MAAVRVPPSAWRTSQSRAMVFSPSADRSMQARSDRPTSRLISWVRPPILPRTDSRPERSWVAAGSMAYSAVSHPRPVPRRQRGTPSVTLAVHMTRVWPKVTRTEPAGCEVNPRVMVTSRRAPSVRPSDLLFVEEVTGADPSRGCARGSDLDAEVGLGDPDLAVVLGRGLRAHRRAVGPRRDMGEHQHPDAGAGGDTTRLDPGHVDAGRAVLGVCPRRLAQEHVRVRGHVDQLIAVRGVAAVGQDATGRRGHAQSVRLRWMVDARGAHGERHLVVVG